MSKRLLEKIPGLGPLIEKISESISGEHGVWFVSPKLTGAISFRVHDCGG